MRYIYKKQVLYLYQEVTKVSGGSIGIRDEGLLESALYRPQATFGGQDLYPDIFSKAAVLCHSLISNHPFVDGNKRVGYVSARLMLRLNGYDLDAPENARFRMVMDIASGKLSEKAISNWFKSHSKPYSSGLE